MDKVLPTGAVLSITPLAYKDAWHVAQAILKELERLKIDLGSIDLEQLAKVDAKDMPKIFLALKDPICGLLSSQKIVENVDKCFEKCTYNNARVKSDTFEAREARKDYLYASFYALWENVSPFFEGLSSSLQTS